jgi:predicted heme/steroid binding protein
MSIRELSKAFISFVVLGVISLGILFFAEGVIGSAKVEDDIQLSSIRNNQGAQVSQLSQVDQLFQSEPGMTLEELSAFNGTDGQSSYIAVDGIIYDVSKVSSWKIGTHYGLQAGQNITEAFSTSPHSKSILNKAVVIGVLRDEKLPEKEQTVLSNTNQDSTNSKNIAFRYMKIKNKYFINNCSVNQVDEDLTVIVKAVI